MSIRKKIMLLLVLPIFGLAVFVIFSSYLLNDISSNLRKATSETFSPMLNKDLPEINTLNLDIILLLNADRDAYQAHLAELKSSIAQTVPEQKKAAKSNMENLLQIEQRTNSIKSISSKREKALFVQFKDKYAEWKKYTRAAIRTDENILRLKQRPDTDPLVLKKQIAARNKISATALVSFEAMRNCIDLLEAELENRIIALAKLTNEYGGKSILHINNMAEKLSLAIYLFIILGSVLTVISLIIGLIFSGTIVRPLKKSVKVASLIASSDLEGALNSLAGISEKHSDDEAIILMTEMATMVNTLNLLVGEVKLTSINLVSTSNSITASSREQEVTINELRAATNESVSSTKEISATSKQLVITMDEVASASEKTAGLAETGSDGLSRMEDSMEQIGSATISISSKLEDINEKTSNISKVVSTITKVSEQTNLLSLNASIEAEKAGEYGKGFAIVAREIRRLADQTAVAGLEITKMVKEMQSSVSTGVMSMEKFTEDVKKSISESQKISTQIEGIITEVQSLPDKFNIVTEGMKQQAYAAQQINESMTQLNECSENSSEAVNAFNDVIRQLNKASNNLQKQLAVFKVTEKADSAS